MKMKPSAASSVLEILESRLAPAGLVTLSLTPAGALTLTGDALANDLQITDVGGGFWNIAPTAGGTTLFRMNGGPALAAITFAAPLSVTGNLGAGNDVAELSGLNVAKTLTLNGNDGNDSILLSGVGIGGAAVVDTGAGNDDVDFTSTDFFSTSTVRMGTGADYFTAGGDLFFGRGLNVDLGTGQNTFDVNAVTLQSNGALSAVGGGTAVEAQAFILATGTGVVNGALTLRTSTASPTTFEIGSQAGDSLQITGAMTLQSGTGTDNVILREALRVGGTLGISLSNGANSVQTGDLITLNAGHLSYTGGTGQDSVTFASDTVNVTGNLSFNGGAGTNLLDLNPAVSLRIGGGLSYSGSTGNDTLLIDGPDAMIGGLVNMNASSGNNALGFDATVGSAGALTYLGGAGNDVVDVGENSGASSLITIRGNTASASAQAARMCRCGIPSSTAP